MQTTPRLIGRRALTASLALLAPACAQAQAPGATPRQTTGPFYPTDWSGDADADLVRVTGEAAQAQGVVTHLRGRLLALDGAPLSGARIEIWQCDARGIYRHPRDRETDRDPGFQGRGRTLAGRDGAGAGAGARRGAGVAGPAAGRGAGRGAGAGAWRWAGGTAAPAVRGWSRARVNSARFSLTPSCRVTVFMRSRPSRTSRWPT